MHRSSSHLIEMRREINLSAPAAVTTQGHSLLVIIDCELLTGLICKEYLTGSFDLHGLVQSGSVVFRGRAATEEDFTIGLIEERLAGYCREF